MVVQALSGDPQGKVCAFDDDQAVERLGGGDSSERAVGAGYVAVAGCGRDAVCGRTLLGPGVRGGGYGEGEIASLCSRFFQSRTYIGEGAPALWELARTLIDAAVAKGILAE